MTTHLRRPSKVNRRRFLVRTFLTGIGARAKSSSCADSTFSSVRSDVPCEQSERGGGPVLVKGDLRGLCPLAAGPAGVHPHPPSAAVHPGPLRLHRGCRLSVTAERRGRLQRGARDSHGKEVQQRPVRRSDRLRVLPAAVCVVPRHRSSVGSLRQATFTPPDYRGDDGRLRAVGAVPELRRLPFVPRDGRSVQGQRGPLRRRRGRHGRPQSSRPRDGHDWRGFLGGLHGGTSDGGVLGFKKRRRARLLPDAGVAGVGLQRRGPPFHLAHAARNAVAVCQGLPVGLRGPPRPAQPAGLVQLLRREPNQRSALGRKNGAAESVGSGLFLLPLPLLRPGVHAEFPHAPTLPLHEHAARKDVLLCGRGHGVRPRRIRAQDQTRTPRQSRPHGRRSFGRERRLGSAFGGSSVHRRPDARFFCASGLQTFSRTNTRRCRGETRAAPSVFGPNSQLACEARIEAAKSFESRQGPSGGGVDTSRDVRGPPAASVLSPLTCAALAIFFGRCLLFAGHRRADPGLSSHRTVAERRHALRRLGALLLCGSGRGPVPLHAGL